VPANFNSNAQAATIRACTGGIVTSTGGYGGLEKVVLVDEPIAAAYSLGLHEETGKPLRVLVVDFGGGTLDLALLDIGRAIEPFGFKELARDATSLGGATWDREIAIWALRECGLFTDEEIEWLMDKPNDICHNTLFSSCQKAKEFASFEMKQMGMENPKVPLDPALINQLKAKFVRTITAGEDEQVVFMPSKIFLGINKRLLPQCDLVCNRLFGYARERLGVKEFGWKDLDRVYLAGGGSLLTSVQRWFTDRWGGKAPLIDEKPQHAVAKGAALLAERWQQGTLEPKMIARTRYPKTIGLLTYPKGRTGEPDFCRVIPRGQALPIKPPKQRKIPVRGDSRLQRLEIDFAEREYEPDDLIGIADLKQETRKQLSTPEKLATLTIQNLPPGPNSGEREQATVTVECGVNGAPRFQIEFRGKVEFVDLDPQTENWIHIQSNGSGRIVLGRNGDA
jgi:molecular chaperone DnaK (HSP70)